VRAITFVYIVRSVQLIMMKETVVQHVNGMVVNANVGFTTFCYEV